MGAERQLPRQQTRRQRESSRPGRPEVSLGACRHFENGVGSRPTRDVSTSNDSPSRAHSASILSRGPRLRFRACKTRIACSTGLVCRGQPPQPVGREVQRPAASAQAQQGAVPVTRGQPPHSGSREVQRPAAPARPAGWSDSPASGAAATARGGAAPGAGTKGARPSEGTTREGAGKGTQAGPGAARWDRSTARWGTQPMRQPGQVGATRSSMTGFHAFIVPVTKGATAISLMGAPLRRLEPSSHYWCQLCAAPNRTTSNGRVGFELLCIRAGMRWLFPSHMATTLAPVRAGIDGLGD